MSVTRLVFTHRHAHHIQCAIALLGGSLVLFAAAHTAETRTSDGKVVDAEVSGVTCVASSLS
jgi:hypothetical protein